MSKPPKEKKTKLPEGMAYICTCGNQGYTALVNNTHLKDCLNYIQPTYSISLQLDNTHLEGTGATMLEALRSIQKPVKITTKSVITVSNGAKKFSRALTIPLAQRLFRHGFQPIQARNLELLIK